MNQLLNIRINKIESLVNPNELLEKYQLNENNIDFLLKTRKLLCDIISGKEKKFIVIIGPCSIHDYNSALEYATRLSFYCKKYESKMLIVMRVYFEKPRTTVGWKGFIYDPDLDNRCRINLGLSKARELMVKITELNVPIGCEFLDTITPQYFSDLVSWGAIGARTTESQIHRQLASGLSVPIGFKNGTDGNIKIATDAMIASKHSHTFCGVDGNGKCSIVHTKGNEFTHVILRGSNQMPNYYMNFIDETFDLMAKNNLVRPILIDCSHDNSNKNFKKQSIVLDEILHMNAFDKIMGVMIESNLVEGNQKINNNNNNINLTYGQSITDGCIGWIETIEILDKIYNYLEKNVY
jgi:3-deoxy-7-phosphoheptulonate synthase